MNRHIGPEPDWDPYKHEIEGQSEDPWKDEREANNLDARGQRGLDAARKILDLSRQGSGAGLPPALASEPSLFADPPRQSLRVPAAEIPIPQPARHTKSSPSGRGRHL